MTKTTLIRAAVAGLALLIVNSAYLVAFPAASVFYMANVLLHLALGLALMAVAACFVKRLPLPVGAVQKKGEKMSLKGTNRGQKIKSLRIVQLFSASIIYRYNKQRLPQCSSLHERYPIPFEGPLLDLFSQTPRHPSSNASQAGLPEGRPTCFLAPCRMRQRKKGAFPRPCP